MTKIILVTGSAGMMGANFCRYLLERGYKVVGIDDFSGGKKDFLPVHKNFKNYYLKINRENLKWLYNIFEIHRPVSCFHFAAAAHECLSPFTRCSNYENNLISSAAIINSCIKYKCKLIAMSSIAVYGGGDLRPDHSGFQEQDMPVIPDPYGIAKYAMELDIQHADHQFDLPYTIFRPHNVISEFQAFYDRYRNVAAIFVRKILDGEPLQIYGDGKQTRGFSDMTCLCPFFERAIEEFDGEIFNIGTDKITTVNELAEITLDVAQKLGYSGTIEYTEPRHEVKHAIANHEKVKSYGFRDETNLSELVERLFVWAKSQKKYELNKIDYEIEGGIYSFWK